MINSPKHLTARELATAGIPVIRLQENGKRPTTPNGLKDRTADLSVIDGWYEVGDWNIGICPADFGCFAVDFDGIDPILGPATRLHKTPNGYHALYKGDAPPSAKKLPGIDIRGRESYILAPGSTIDNVQYEVVDQRDPVQAPEWMLDIFRKPHHEPLSEVDYEQDGFAALAAAYNYMDNLIRQGSIPTRGNRNDHATKFLLQLHGYGLTKETATALFEKFLQSCGGARPDEGDYKIIDLIERIWSGRTGTNPPGSELPGYGSDLLKQTTTETGGPKLLNGDDLDDTKVEGGWQSYDIAKMPEPPPTPMLINEWVEQYVFDYHEGGGGIGKSYIAQQEAVCLQAGLSVLGEEVQKTDVFYLNYEEPQDEYERRLYRIARCYGNVETQPDGTTKNQWYENNPGKMWPFASAVKHNVNITGLYTAHLRQNIGSHILRVTKDGRIIITRFGNQFLDTLAKRRDKALHSYVIFDGLMDAILFEGSTRSEDEIARQVIALLDRWCVEYDMTGRGIIHPSRAGERTGGESYAPAWTTKPRARQTYQRVTFGGKGAKVTDYLPPEAVFTRRTITKRSHGMPGKFVDMQFRNGIWVPIGTAGGGQEAQEVAVSIAVRQDAIGARIKRDGGIGKSTEKLSNKHQIIVEYRHRTGKDHGVEHFLDVLEQAEKEGKVAYHESKAGDRIPAGYFKKQTIQ